MTSWNYIVIALCLLLLIFLLWKEWTRENRARLNLRIAITVIAVSALAGIGMKLYYRPKPARSSQREAVLLTGGYDPDSLRQFLKTTPIQVCDNAAALPAALSKLHLFGYGLHTDEWSALPLLPTITWHPPAASAGIRSVQWTERLRPGHPFRVQGQAEHKGKPVRLFLTGMGGRLDSVTPAKDGLFELTTIPAQSGRALYQLLALEGSDTLEREQIPVEVLPGQDLSILFLAASPDFENRFLADWLASGGYPLAVRTAISKDKYDLTQVNRPAASLSSLTPGLLDKFDVVIADAAELRSMGAAQVSLLERQIAEKGMGLIIRSDSTAGPALAKNIFSLAVARSARDSAGLPYIRDKPGLLALTRDSLSHMLTGLTIHGSGKIALTTLTSTYTRVLAGDKKGYTAAWSSLLEQVARQQIQPAAWQTIPRTPIVNEPVRLLLQTPENGQPQGILENNAIYLNQHPWLPAYWEGWYYPKEAGWQELTAPQGDSSWWYSWSQNDWSTLRREERRSQTEDFLRTYQASAGGKPERAEEPVPIPKGWFYILLLICCVVLWVERKI